MEIFMKKKVRKIKDVSKLEWENIAHKYEDEDKFLCETDPLYNDIYGGSVEYSAENKQMVYVRPKNYSEASEFRNEFWNRYYDDIWD
jgi:hypothetical protein